MKDILEKLVRTPCIPQFQVQMEDLLQDEINFAEVEVDYLGNVHLTPESGDESGVTFLAHLSEIGFVVEHIDNSGFLRFKEISNVDDRTLLGQRMIVHGDNRSVRGVVGIKPPHLLRKEEKEKKVKIEDMFIDAGAYSRGETKELGIDIGTPITLEGWLKKLPDGRLFGKALDDRLGCYAVIEALRKITSQGIKASAWLLSQEATFPRNFDPDYAIAVDATLAGPYPAERVKVERYEVPTEIEKGPALTLREDDVSISQKVRRLVKKAAEEAGIQLQIEASSRAGVKRVNPMERNVRSAILSLPVKYIRTPGEIASISDLEDTIKLLESFVKVIE